MGPDAIRPGLSPERHAPLPQPRWTAEQSQRRKHQSPTSPLSVLKVFFHVVFKRGVSLNTCLKPWVVLRFLQAQLQRCLRTGLSPARTQCRECHLPRGTLSPPRHTPAVSPGLTGRRRGRPACRAYHLLSALVSHADKGL